MTKLDLESEGVPDVVSKHIDPSEEVKEVYRPNRPYVWFRTGLAALMSSLLLLGYPAFGLLSIVLGIGPPLLIILFFIGLSQNYIITDQRFILLIHRPLFGASPKAVDIDNANKASHIGGISKTVKVVGEDGTVIKFRYLMDDAGELEAKCKNIINQSRD